MRQTEQRADQNCVAKRQETPCVLPMLPIMGLSWLEVAHARWGCRGYNVDYEGYIMSIVIFLVVGWIILYRMD